MYPGKQVSLLCYLLLHNRSITHKIEWLQTAIIFIVVSHDSIGFSRVTPLLESLGSHVVAFRVDGLHVYTAAFLYMASSQQSSLYFSLAAQRKKDCLSYRISWLLYLLLVKAGPGQNPGCG